MKLMTARQAAKIAQKSDKRLNRPIAPSLIPVRIEEYTDLGFSNLYLKIKGKHLNEVLSALLKKGFHARAFLKDIRVNLDEEGAKPSLIYDIEVMW